MKKAAVIVLVLVLTLSAISAWAQNADRNTRQRQPGVGGQGFAGRMMMASPASAVMPPQPQMIERQAEVLQLTDQQKTALQAALTKSEAALQPLQQRLGQACQALRAAVAGPQNDAARVKTLATQAQAAEAAVVDAHIATWAQIRGILSAEQMAKLQQGMVRRQQGPGGPGQGPGPGPGGQPPPPPPGGEPGPPPPAPGT